jgi:8-amino-3,8-dideoxy-alpha-D-manno-octulosonate transaminase
VLSALVREPGGAVRRYVRPVQTDRLAIDGGAPVCTRRLPLGKGIDLLGEQEIASVTEVLREQSLFRYHSARTASRVDAFESALCEAFGCRYALTVSSGTAALRTSLAALGVGPGDEVIVPAFTFIATVSAVVAIGADAVFAEVDDSLTLDPEDVTDKVSECTAAVIPVHLENVACDIDAIRGCAAFASVPVLEDAAQAIGVTYKGRYAGTLGALGACSLQQSKNITTGEGGVVLTDDEDLYVRAARFHDQGGQFVTQYRGERGPERGEPFMGDNLRMTEIGGAIGLVQLQRLPSLLRAMRANHDRVRDAIGGVEGLQPRRLPDRHGIGGSSLTWFAPDATTARAVVAALRAEGAPAAQMYDGRPVYANPAVRTRRGADLARDRCPRTEDLVERSVTIGVGPAFTEEDCEQVAAAVHKVARHVLGST